MGPRIDDEALEVHDRRRRLSHLLHIKSAPCARGLAAQVVQLRKQAAAFRSQAILLNAKLAMMEHEREDRADELRAIRDALVETTARVDRAVDGIDAATAMERGQSQELKFRSVDA